MEDQNVDEVVASLDIGTSTIRCILLDKYGCVRGQYKADVNLLIPEPGFVEIDPEELWDTVIDVIRKTVQISKLEYGKIRSIGISSQRNSFMLWNKISNHNYHNFITWNDIRADAIVKHQNNSIKLKLFRFASKLLYIFTRKRRFLVGSMFKLTNPQITPRLMWVLKNIPGINSDIEDNNVAYGTIDTWILYKLSNSSLHVTDVSNASASGLFDPYTLTWSYWPFKLFGIPMNILPCVVDSAGCHFGFTNEKIFGRCVPIHCSIADQSASLFGSCCFNAGDIKVTLGTGTFLNVNTGSIPHASFKGLYPLVAWKFAEELTYMAEGASNDTGLVVKWAQQLGLLDNPGDSSQIAQSIENNNGVYFVPAFSGLQVPREDADAGTGFIGLNLTTKKSHLIRAILESIVYGTFHLFKCFCEETDFEPDYLRLDGGVSCNDFVMQMLADILNLSIRTADTEDMSAMGSAFLAGLSCGVWNNKRVFYNFVQITRTYSPSESSLDYYKKEYLNWCRAVNRFIKWHQTYEL